VTLPRLRTFRQKLVAGVVALAVLVAVIAVIAVVSSAPAIIVRQQMVAGTPEASTAVQLDTTLYLPHHTPAPAVLLAHGFGGSKTDLDAQARSLARAGYVVLAYSARGFGKSGGLIHLDAPAYEVADASKLVTYLATLPQVQLDAPGDPRVGVSGSSYGGGLALMLAGYDKRIDAVSADITWNSLVSSLFPNAAKTPGGVFKKLWAAYLFGSAIQGTSASGCGRFAANLCQAYQQLAQGKPSNTDVLSLLQASSPASVLSKIKAPTLLTQGEQDSLFPLSEANANALGIAAVGTRVSVMWRAGGHDTGDGTGPAQAATRKWFDAILKRRQQPDPSFSMNLQGAGISAQNGQRVNENLVAKHGYPGTDGHAPFSEHEVTVTGSAQSISAPAGGSPAAISSLPGLSSLLDLAGQASGLTALTNIPGQTASFTSAPFSKRALITGASTVTIRVTSATTTDATLFAALRDVAPNGTTTLPSQLVTPISLTGLTPGKAQQVIIALPSIVSQIESGHRLRLTLSTTDQGYLLPTDPRSYSIALTAGAATVSIPSTATSTVGGGRPYILLIIGLLAVVVALILGFAMIRRAERRPKAGVVLPDGDVPVIVSDLVKEYSDGFRAVDGVTLRVDRGQIVGLLGPNGAGKTTTLRVLMGLIRPTSGSVSIFGAEVVAGSPVLSRVGAFVEGPGLLPHLSGRANLRLYWAATGRPGADAQTETALEIAGLGSSIDRLVKTYSQGMRQRLAIAQAMLGLPELLVLDEPTNGLDPPQIAEMRNVLRSYAATGRTVVISSHLLAEVEQTCSHVVVMHRGRLVAAGSVAEIAGTDRVNLSVDDPGAARELLAAAGMVVTEVPARRALEDVFLELVGDTNE
jgi:ABC-2 type transport system ATP-binding protein